MLRFDHIAIGSETLSQGAGYVSACTGLTVPVGGEHPLMGTHNLVMSTGTDTFFEVIAINPAAPKPAHSRWFGLDVNQFMTPRPHAWILNSDDLDADLEIAKSLGIDLGHPLTITRGDMTWRFAVRSDGRIPLQGTAPMIMEWPLKTQHPANRMTDFGARIKTVNLDTPHASNLNKLLNRIGADNIPVKITDSVDPKLAVTLTLKNGRDVVLD